MRFACAAFFALAAIRTARAQGLSEPLVLGDGRVTLAGDVSATFSCTNDAAQEFCGDDTGFFNYSDYKRSTLRLFRLDLETAVRAGKRLSFLAQLRTENGSAPRAYALYLRLRPWETQDFDIQAGRIPPTFGAYARRAYAHDNILIGVPLAYQYLTSLRPDAIPASVDELLAMRGRGWLSSFSVGRLTPDRGLPIASAFRWDTGVQVHTGVSWMEAAASVTTGSLGNPLIADDNSGKQVAGRLVARPLAGLIMGASISRAPFLTRAATQHAGTSTHHATFVQRAIGADAEYSRDYYLVRVESILSRWTLPTIAQPLRALATSIEGRYKLGPGLHAAARFDHLGFSTLTGAAGPNEWDAPVTRVEIGGGYLLRRNLQLKVSYQRNVRDGGRVRRLNIGALQTVFWF